MQQYEKAISQRHQRIQKKLSEVPASKRRLYQRAFEGKASKRDAIKAFCNECMMDVTSEIRFCTAVTCPLWMYRPYQITDSNDKKATD